MWTPSGTPRGSARSLRSRRTGWLSLHLAARGISNGSRADIYCWLTYRASYLAQPVEIPWPALALQFGAGYAEVRKFRYFFLRQARAVLRLYPEARISEGAKGLILKPASPHVPRRLPA